MTDNRKHTQAVSAGEAAVDIQVFRQGLEREIDRLNRSSSRGLQAAALFLAVTLLARGGFSFLPGADPVRALLGAPPSARVIGTALLLYTFFAVVLSLCRMAAGIGPQNCFGHVGYLTGFYLFYYFGKSLDENFWAVFAAGVTVLGVESYRIWTFAAENIAKKQEQLSYAVRTGRTPPEE